MGIEPFVYRLKGTGVVQSHIVKTIGELLAAIAKDDSMQHMSVLVAAAAFQLDSIQYGQLIPAQVECEHPPLENSEIFFVHSEHVRDSRGKTVLKHYVWSPVDECWLEQAKPETRVCSMIYKLYDEDSNAVLLVGASSKGNMIKLALNGGEPVWLKSADFHARLFKPCAVDAPPGSGLPIRPAARLV
jgi:hypothetical protein